MATPFHVELTTPERILFSGEAEEVTMRTDAGEIAFLAHHEDFIGAVDITVGKIHVVDPGGDADGSAVLVAAIHGGFVHVDANGVRILAGVAELAAEIDVDRARAALAGAEGAGRGDRGTDHAEPTTDGEDVASSPAMVAIIDPESTDARTRRATARLEAAGVSPAA
jgi:F-type H+-transporting ATPase subunit epsilon